MVSYIRRALHGTATVFVLSLFSALAGYILRLLLARRLSIEDYGLFFALFSFINLLGLFKDFGLSYALVKFIPELEVTKSWGRIKSLILSSALIQLVSAGIITAVLVVAAPALMKNVFHSDKIFMMVLFAFIFFISFPQGIVGICLLGFQRMFLYASQDFTRNLLVILFTLLFLGQGIGIAAPAYAYLVVYALSFAIFFAIFVAKVFPRVWKARAEFVSSNFSQLLLFGLPAMITIFGNNILQYTDSFMLAYLTNLTNVGLYQVAQPIATLVFYFSTAAAVVATPLASELMARRKYKELRKGVELLHTYIFAMVVPIAAALVLFPEIFIRLLFGDKFLAAAPALQILAVGAVFGTIGYINLNILFGLGKPKLSGRLTFVCAIVNLALNFLLIPHYGLIGAALATTASYFLMLALSSKSIWRAVKLRAHWLVWGKTLVAAAAFIAVLAAEKSLLQLNPWFEFFIGVISGGLLYVCLLFLLRVSSMEEIMWIKDHFLQYKTK
jgi:O-antigen/teichoic acid export membrane protein